MGKPDSIPIDDVSLIYADASPEVRSAVSMLLRYETFISITADDDGGVIINWHSNPGRAIAMLVGAIATGTREFGDVWLHGLLEYITNDSKN